MDFKSTLLSDQQKREIQQIRGQYIQAINSYQFKYNDVNSTRLLNQLFDNIELNYKKVLKYS